MHLSQLVLTFFMFSVSTFAQDVETYVDPRVASTAHVVMTTLVAVKDLARKRGMELSPAQTLFASDMLMGYYTRPLKAPGTQANLVWLPVEKHLRNAVAPVFGLVGEVIDPLHGIEHLQLPDYSKLEPKLLAQKIREQRKHLLVMDDMAELHEVNVGGPQTIATQDRLNRANEYDDWLMMETPDRLTIFVIDEDGFVLANMDQAFVSLIDFIGDKGEMMTLSCANVLKN